MHKILLVAVLASTAASAETGTEFIARFKKLKGAAAQDAIVKSVGEPSWVEVTVKPAKAAKGAAAHHEAVLHIARDYVSVGEESDFVRMPMTPQSAQRIADRFHASLPTKKLVDDIYAAAAVKLSPSPLVNVNDNPDKWLLHQKAIEKQLASLGGGDGIIAGQKKDIVIGNMMARSPKKVVIYGWHQKSGKAIQPESSVHGDFYLDPTK
jgi:hypothetical protein